MSFDKDDQLERDDFYAEQLNFEFGGKIQITIFDQDKVWRDIRGLTWKLEEMEDSHRGNLIAFLERNALRFFIKWEMYHMFSTPIGLYDDIDFNVLPWDPFDDPDRPLGWLRDTPLYQKLDELEYPPGKVDFTN